MSDQPTEQPTAERGLLPPPLESVEVYAPGFTKLFTIPKRDILHTPENAAKLVLCNSVRSSDPKASAASALSSTDGCKDGDSCKFVHVATLDNAVASEVHVNYAWPSLRDVAYDRYDTDEDFAVALPNGSTATATVPARLVLKTNAVASTRRPLSHCAHYFYNRLCNRGPSCNFVHVVHIDPQAKPFQRAPVPTEHLGQRKRKKKVSGDGFNDEVYREYCLQSTVSGENVLSKVNSGYTDEGAEESLTFLVSDEVQSLPGQSLPGQSLPGQSLPGQSLAGQSLAGQSLTGEVSALGCEVMAALPPAPTGSSSSHQQQQQQGGLIQQLPPMNLFDAASSSSSQQHHHHRPSSSAAAAHPTAAFVQVGGSQQGSVLSAASSGLGGGGGQLTPFLLSPHNFHPNLQRGSSFFTASQSSTSATPHHQQMQALSHSGLQATLSPGAQLVPHAASAHPQLLNNPNVLILSNPGQAAMPSQQLQPQQVHHSTLTQQPSNAALVPVYLQPGVLQQPPPNTAATNTTFAPQPTAFPQPQQQQLLPQSLLFNPQQPFAQPTQQQFPHQQQPFSSHPLQQQLPQPVQAQQQMTPLQLQQQQFQQHQQLPPQ